MSQLAKKPQKDFLNAPLSEGIVLPTQNNLVLHTEKEKKQYGKLEKEIKCTLNELLLLNRIHLAGKRHLEAYQ